MNPNRLVRRAAGAGAALALLAALAGCASSSPTATSAAPEETSDAPALEGELTVYAAASLTAAFDELAAEFEAEHPGVDVLPIVYDGSSTLATQLVEGAPADVFASADERTMATVDDAGLLAADPELFATNTLRIVVPAGNPGGVAAIEDLANPDLQVVLCAPEVPCGAASHQLLDLDGVTLTPVSEEQNVTAVLTKVRAGEADAGLVYSTDAVAAGDEVETIVPANADEVVNRYPIAALAAAGNPDVAAAFVAFVLSDEGQALLAEYGFGAP
ncbi:molybdate ABC transporter substrate-binding protein [Agromyces intestinalis]|uniref:Molybdate ABC transporter substrate-binding protein n=1 Tax=Agromyces intestinalis TaxID=2592652 RepID=A0A5C1YE59_9MICO|nr:molybdate ABC transporter substrate-binding protein [Agromyces intestinalis]QEO13715.1 molybdate ABC transporter substrate-binding protein [Agromyces intestinalis]